jgi:sarcosine oxidase subunit gamma
MADARIAERAVGSIVQIATWPAGARTTASMIEALLGCAPPSSGKTSGTAAATLLGLSPGRWLLVADDASWPSKLATAFAEGQAVVTDLSAARLTLRIDGPGALLSLRQGIAIDLHPASFPPGSCAQTLLHHMGVLLHRLDATTFDLLVGRSYGRSLQEWLHDAS